MAKEITIGIWGGYASGKATFINALLQYPYFIMSRMKHNSKKIIIQGGNTEHIEWFFKENDEKAWCKSTCSLRHVRQSSIKIVKALIPNFCFTNLIFHDFPVLCSLDDFHAFENKSIIDYGVLVLDAEYAEKKIHFDIIHCLIQYLNDNLIILLNKSELLDSPDETVLEFRNDLHIPKSIKVFPISAQLELDRILDSKKRDKMYAYTPTRKKMMHALDANFAKFRNILIHQVFPTISK